MYCLLFPDLCRISSGVPLGFVLLVEVDVSGEKDTGFDWTMEC